MPRPVSKDSIENYSKLWGKKGELWNKSHLPDFTEAGYHAGKKPIPNLPVSIRLIDCGGKGDGVTDNTAALRIAIKKCRRGGSVYISRGVFLFTDTILIERGDISIRGNGTASTILYFERGLEELYPKFNKRFTNQTDWSWSGAMITFTGNYAEGGVESLSIKFPDKLWTGHNFHERAFNGVGFTQGFHNGWIRSVNFIGCDMGIWIASSVHHVTVEDWALAFGALRNSEPISGHHGVNINGSFNLLQRFEINGKFQHDLSVEGDSCRFNVFRKGNGRDLCIDHHNHHQSFNLFTNLNAGIGSRLFFSGGNETPRGISFNETYWNITARSYLPYCDFYDEGSKRSTKNICVAFKTLRGSELGNIDHNWLETVPMQNFLPKDLYTAQMALLGYKSQ